ncbi:hypothetical protein DAPPUDRAFT_107654 [Daphnia pulex]|uniref:Uncharacterized protein n=1 Tax=Daphnia pulex TaxID=6669 RepID=E9GXU7_DAPPU|nr:hypothetical protein DAPPUDRAFT_107654 [Daphnia pulex]|eukprot:EFX75724.1 hypothetical protein DAPPUDRAFT_107654 [Daphnia pulex]
MEIIKETAWAVSNISAGNAIHFQAHHQQRCCSVGGRAGQREMKIPSWHRAAMTNSTTRHLNKPPKEFFFLVGSCHLLLSELLSLSVTPTGPSPSVKANNINNSSSSKALPSAAVGTLAAATTPSKRELPDIPVRMTTPNKMATVHEILGGDSTTTRLQTPPPRPAATRQQIGTGQRAGLNEGTTNNNCFHSLDRDAAATTTTRTTAAADAIQCYPLTTPTTIPIIPDLSNPHSGEPGGKFDSQLDPPTHFSLY